MRLRRKAQVGGLQSFILTIVTVTIVLAIGLIVMDEMKDTAKLLEPFTTVINETVDTSGSVSQGAELFISASGCRNTTSSNIVIGTDCNISSTGLVTVNATCCNDNQIFLDYTHYTPSAAFNSTKTITTKLATVPTWIGIIIIIALAFIVLSFFIGKRQ